MAFRGLMIFLTVLSCPFYMSGQPMQALEDNKVEKLQLGGGPMAGANMSNFIHSGMPGCSSRMRMGFYGGGFLQLYVEPWFSLGGDLLFHYKCSEFAMLDDSGPFRQWSTQFAVYAMCHVKFKNKTQLGIGLGPYTDFGLSAAYSVGGEKHNLYSRNGSAGHYPPMATTETGIGLKVVYEFATGFQLTASYRISINNVAEAGNGGVHMNPQTFDFGIAYRFHK